MSDLDLVLERTLDVPRARVWQAWTDPELLKRWFAPMGFHEGWGKCADQLEALAREPAR